VNQVAGDLALQFVSFYSRAQGLDLLILVVLREKYHLSSRGAFLSLINRSMAEANSMVYSIFLGGSQGDTDAAVRCITCMGAHFVPVNSRLSTRACCRLAIRAAKFGPKPTTLFER
jgi:hypothetical protein